MRRRARLLLLLLLATPALALGALYLAHLRRLAVVEVSLRADLAADAARPAERRRALRGDGRDENLFEAIERAIPGADAAPAERSAIWNTSTPKGVFREGHRTLFNLYAYDRSEDVNAQDRLAPRWAPELEPARALVAPVVARLRAALQAERVALAVRDDPERLPPWSQLTDALVAGFWLEALRAREDARARDMARLATDLWRFGHDLAREGGLDRLAFGLGVSARALPLIEGAVGCADEAVLDELDQELAALEATRPSFARALRRERLAVVARRLREPLRREVDPSTLPLPAWLAHTEVVRRFLATNRTAELDALWRAVEECADADPALARPRVVALAGPPAPPPKSFWMEVADEYRLPEDIDDLTGSFDGYLADAARLREARVLIAARRSRSSATSLPSMKNDKCQVTSDK